MSSRLFEPLIRIPDRRPRSYHAAPCASGCDHRRNQHKRVGKMVPFCSVANVGEKVFVNPTTFDITRKPSPHVVFDVGVPRCHLGSQLAKMRQGSNRA